MKKKNLIILLLIPFLIALLGVVTINTTFSFIDNDIIGISWSYQDVEAFKMRDSMYALNAVGINEKDYPAGAGNELIWTVQNKNFGDVEVHAEIVKSGTQYFLKTVSPGDVIVTCSNFKGNVFRSMTAIIYQDGVVYAQTKNASSQANIDSNQYFGQYDMANGSKKAATIEFEISVVPETMKSELYIEDQSSNITFDLSTSTLKILNPGNAFFTIGLKNSTMITPFTYTFKVVENGVNVYTYDDLMNCTNKSEEGETVVLQKSFESMQNAFIYDGDEISISGNQPVLKYANTTCFGNFDVKTKSIDFSKDIYRFSTTFNSNYIKSWNEYMEKKGGDVFLSDEIIAGIRIQKDFYGNGYSINLHDLTYPSGSIPYNTPSKVVNVAFPNATDIFKGALAFYSLGNPTSSPLVAALGQDNIGMYVDGDNITVNDLNLRNCDFGDLLLNLSYSGTVLETNGDNITIKNCKLTSGRNIVRSFSSMNVVIDNCYIAKSRNFLIVIGSNEYIPVNGEKQYALNDTNYKETKTNLDTYFAKGGVGDNVLNNYILGSYTDVKKMSETILKIHNSLCDSTVALENKGSMTINDTYFHLSGISAIALESMFNGPFLYSASPSYISKLLAMIKVGNVSLADFLPTNLGGTSYPVEVNINGNTRFYDYKTFEGLDIGGLITENISSVLDGAGDMFPDIEGNVNIDTIFPIKEYLFNAAGSKYTEIIGEEKYINVPISYYGGGINLSKVNINSNNLKENLSNELIIDLLEKHVGYNGNDANTPTGELGIQDLKNMVLKCVTVVTGYEPFKFVVVKGQGNMYLMNDDKPADPNLQDLIENAKGE